MLLSTSRVDGLRRSRSRSRLRVAAVRQRSSSGVLRAQPSRGPRLPAPAPHATSLSGGRRRRARTDCLGQRKPREQVDHVVLAQVDEREPERARRTPSRARQAPDRPPRARAQPSPKCRNAARASPPADFLQENRTATARGDPRPARPTSTMIRRMPADAPLLGGPPGGRRGNQRSSRSGRGRRRRRSGRGPREAVRMPPEDPAPPRGAAGGTRPSAERSARSRGPWSAGARRALAAAPRSARVPKTSLSKSIG